MYKDYSNEPSSSNFDCFIPEGTLILSNKDNTAFYTAECFYILHSLKIQLYNTFIFEKDKTPKIVQYNSQQNLLFLVDTEAPFKLYALNIALEEENDELETQAKNKWFRYVYETNLEMACDLTKITSFDLYLQEKVVKPENKSNTKPIKSQPSKTQDLAMALIERTFILFIRDLNKIHILGIDQKLISEVPEIVNKDYDFGKTIEKEKQKKIEALNASPQTKETLINAEIGLKKASEMAKSLNKKGNETQVMSLKISYNLGTQGFEITKRTA